MKTLILKSVCAAFAVVFGSFFLRSDAKALEPIAEENFLAVVSHQRELRQFWKQYGAGMSFEGYRERVYDLNDRRPEVVLLGEGTRSSAEPLILTLPKQSIKFEPRSSSYEVARSTDTIKQATSSSDRGALPGQMNQSPNVDVTDTVYEGAAGALDQAEDASSSFRGVHADGDVVASYIVAFGDSLLSIALRFGFPLEEIAQLNNIPAPYLLKAGQRLIFPADTYSKEKANAESGEKTETHSPGMLGQTAGLSGSMVYVVKYGDTLLEVAYRYGVDLQQLVETNKILPPYDVDVGQSLILPSVDPVASYKPRRMQPATQTANFSVQPDLGAEEERLRAESIAYGPAVTHAGRVHYPVLDGKLGVYCLDKGVPKNELQNIDLAIAEVATTSFGAASLRDALPDLMKTLGYRAATIELLDRESRLHISPGQEYTVRAIRLEPLGDRSQHGALAPVELQVEKIGLTHMDRKDVELAAGDWFSSQGHFTAQIESITEVLNHDAKRIYYQVRYTKKGSARIASVAFSGKPIFTDAHLEKLIPAESMISAGASDLALLRERLVSTSYISDVAFDLVDTEADEDKLLLISTESRVSNRLAGSFYYDNVGQLGLAGEFLLPNLSRREDDLSFLANWDDRVSDVGVNYRQKNFFAYGNDLTFAVSAGQEDHPFYDNNSLTVSLESNWTIHDGMSFSVASQFFGNDENALASEKTVERDFLETSLSLAGKNQFGADAELQWKSALSLSHALSGLTESFVELAGNASMYFRSSRTIGLDVHMGLTYRSFFDGSERAEVSQLYNGGIDSNRGYRYASATTGQWLDSSSITKTYFQLDFPLAKKISLGDSKMIPFLDLSMLSADGFATNEIFWGIGIGTEFKVRSLPVRIDVAMPLLGDDSSVALYFSVGVK